MSRGTAATPAGPSDLPTWPEFMSIATAARFLDCSEGHIRALLRAGLPSVAIGRCRRISKRDLEIWLARLPGAAQAVDQVLAELRRGGR